MQAVSLQHVLQHPAIWRGNACARAGDTVPSGLAPLDAWLPGGGWPTGALTELLSSREGIGELSLLAPALARASTIGRRIILIAPPHVPYAPAFRATGIDTTQLVWVRARTVQDRLWAFEQALRSPACGAALAWSPGPGADAPAWERSLRRLQLATEQGKGLAFLFCPPQSRTAASPAALRLALEPAPDAPDTLRVRILKRRGGADVPPIHFERTADGLQARTQRMPVDPERGTALPRLAAAG